MEYNDVLKFFQNFWRIQNEQKKRGLNDFNLLTTVLKYHDEVRLHSRIIAALLDPNGKHYQSSLFLEYFLKAINLDKWGLEFSKTKVYLEYKDIDIYITDGNKHLIIENKIRAEDQPCQLIKYINIIVEENLEVFDLSIYDKDNIVLDEKILYVIYLTSKDKMVPLGHRKDDKEYIYFVGEKDMDDELLRCSKRSNTKLYVPDGLKKYKAKYKNINYKEHILKSWLEPVQKQVKNITNLNESLQQYIDVVKQVNKNYQGNIMDLKNYIQDKNSNIDLDILFKINEEIKDLQVDLLYELFSQEYDGVVNVNNKLKQKNNHYKDYIYDKKSCEKWFIGTCNDFGSFYKIDDKHLLYVAIGKKNIHFGIVRHKDYTIINSSENDESYGLEYRNKGWRKIKWYSESISSEDYLIEILEKPENSVLKEKVDKLVNKVKSK